MSTTDLAAAALAAARTTLDALQLDDSTAAAPGLPYVDVRVVQLAGRQRDVTARGRDPRAVLTAGRRRDVDVAAGRRTFTANGRPRPTT